MLDEMKISEARDLLLSSDAVLITAGAGMGVDSGLPDFRGVKGFWRAYPPLEKLNLSFEEMAQPKWFSENPRLAWGFYGHRLNMYKNTIPHEGFSLLLEIAQKKKYGYFVYTSNVDGQFQKAGFDVNRIVECHGSIHHFQCSKNCKRELWINDKEVNVNQKTLLAFDPLPSCPYCGEVARPNIMMFSDYGWIDVRTNQQELRLSEWLTHLQNENENAKLCVIEIGAGESIATVRYKGERIADRLNAKLIRVNPKDFSTQENGIGLGLAALEAIQALTRSDHKDYQ